ncbi:MAG: hypothetical protein R6X08_04475 [Desulfosalsimonadaceae bacterium]
MRKTSFAAIVFLTIAFSAVYASAKGTEVLKKTIDIGWFGIERNYHAFAAENNSEGTLQITAASPHRYYFGYVCLNHNWYSFSSRKPLTRDVILERKNSIYIILFGQRNASAGITIMQKDAGPSPPEVSIVAEPETIAEGGFATLRWQSKNADTVTIDQGIGEVENEGSNEVSPAATTSYTITAAGAGGSEADSTTIEVTQPPSISVTEPDGSGDTTDESFTIAWTDTDPDSNAKIDLIQPARRCRFQPGNTGVLMDPGSRPGRQLPSRISRNRRLTNRQPDGGDHRNGPSAGCHPDRRPRGD